MGHLNLKYQKVKVRNKYTHNALTRKAFDQFNAGILDLGDIAKEAKTINTLAAVFDLQEFTAFCNQIDPQLVIPEYLSDFLDWLFNATAEAFTREKKADQVVLWGSLPFFGKFLGDGVLFLWDTEKLFGSKGLGNVVVGLREICEDYEDKFFKIASESYSEVPNRLRVGIARGQALAIGDGRDFVGPCINMASRLQKIASLPFALSRRGFDPERCFHQDHQDDMMVTKTKIRGIGEGELIIIYRKDYEELSEDDKALFHPVSKCKKSKS